jgi:SAM-dependent methyltransferase
MLTEVLTGYDWSRRLIRRAGRKRTNDIVGGILPFVPVGARVLDIGAGTCDVTARLLAYEREVTPIDVQDASCVPGLKPTLFDGRNVPFEDRSFDWALLIDVLHHTDPEPLLREAARVASHILVHEDVFASRRQKYLTFLMDSVTNLEVMGHPHSNKSDGDWRRTFREHGLILRHASQRDFWRFFTCATYVLEAPK